MASVSAPTKLSYAVREPYDAKEGEHVIARVTEWKRRVICLHMARWTALVVSTLFVLLLSGLLVLGLPARQEAPNLYLNRVCRLAKVAFDPHLPCVMFDERTLTDRQALWSVIKTACIPASYVGISYPCVKLDRARGFAVIRSPFRDRLDFIVTPTQKIEGIESLASVKESPPRIWAAAWEERRLLEETSHHRLAWSDVILAINSKSTRSQDQLHVHLGCVNSNLRDALAIEPLSNLHKWRLVRPSTFGSGFFVKFIAEGAIEQNLFDMIFHEIPGGKLFAEKETLAVAGVTRGNWRGFALMVSLEPAPAEELLAPGC